MVFDTSTHVLNALHEGRYDDAEQALARWLETDPYDAASRSLRALSLAALERWDESLAEARRALDDEPELAYCHWVLGLVLADLGKHAEALAHARQAARLAPESAEAPALAGRCLAARKDWAGALAQAERGLQLEPDHPACANLRALALQALGSPEAAQAFIDASATDPSNAFARAGRGWQALQAGGMPDQALPHFYHALEIDPSQEWAREGLAAALKARNPVYRAMLRYFLWMDSLSPRARWMVIVGGIVGYNVLSRVTRVRPELAPALYPLMGAYVLFLLMTWVADPLFDGLLALDREGRAAIPRGRVVAGGVVGLLLLAGVVMGVAGLATGVDRVLMAGVFAGFLVIPVAGTFQCEPGWPRWTMGAYAAAVLALGACGIAIWGEAGAGLVVLATFGAGVGSWLARGLASVTPSRPRRAAR